MTKKRKVHIGLWIALITALVLMVIYFSQVLSFLGLLLASVKSLMIGAMLAFVLNLVMDPVQRWLMHRKNPHLRKMSRSLALLFSLLVVALIVTGIMTLVVPNMIEASDVLIKTLPKYSEDLENFLTSLFKDYPQLAKNITPSDFNWDDILSKLQAFLTKGFSGFFDSAISIIMKIANSFVQLFIIVIFAIYVLTEKQRFVRLYNFFTDLYLSKLNKRRLTNVLRVTNETFKAFVTGECIEAVILFAMCCAGMLVMGMPYAVMISILVGVINMIPMVGAFIGGGIGVFLIFTVSPVKAVIFLVYLCVIQQIESNVFFPRIIGSKVGLPGIYVMMTIVIGGSLFGILGMIFGVPLVASIYKLLKIYYEKLSKERQSQKEAQKTSQPA